jgi:ABC-2 type transport system ATP-binding protein
MMSTPALELHGVTKRFGRFTAVRDLSFTQTRGHILGFLGPNGAGKTTTLRMMLGLMAPDAGTLNVLGAPAGARQSMRIGYLPEERGLYKRMRADRVIAYIAALKGMEFGAARKRARALLERYGLGTNMDTRVEALSKGMAQKVALIASLAHDPELLILDEPFSGLDPINQHSFEDTIRDLAADGKTVLFSTHTMEQAERLCDHLVILARGRKVFDGTPDQARAVLPRRVRIGTDGDLGFLRAVPGVAALTPPNGQKRYWEATLSSSADSAALLAACFDRRMAITHFDVADASLQDAFIALAGAEEREAAQ